MQIGKATAIRNFVPSKWFIFIQKAILSLSLTSPARVNLRSWGRLFLVSGAIQGALCLAFAAENSSDMLQTPVRGVTVAGDLAYLAAGAKGMVVLDVKDPVKPRKISSCNTQGEAWSVAVSQGLAYVANGIQGLSILDITNIANPKIIGSFNPHGNITAVVVTNGLAFLVDNWNGLRIVDVRQPEAPKAVGYITNEFARDVAVSGNYAFLVSNLIGLETVDISNPSKPVSVAIHSIYDHGFGKAIALDGKYAYLALDYAGIMAIDLSDPIFPQRLGQCEVPGFPVGICVANGYAYLASGVGGLNIVDIRDPSILKFVANYQTTGSAFAAATKGTNVFVAEGWPGLEVVNVSQLDSPAWNSSFHLAFEHKGIAAATNLIMTADASDGLKIFSIATGAEPQLVKTLATFSPPEAIVIAGRNAYLAEGANGLQVVDTANFTNALIIASINTSGEANGLAISGSTLCVANGPKGLMIYDVQNPAQPRKLGSLQTAGSAYGVTIDSHYAYIAAGKEGLQIVDISQPTAPRLLGSYDTSGDARGVVVSGNYAFLSAGWTGLEVIDLTDRARPRLVGSHDMPGFAMRVAIRDQKAFVADSLGFSIFDVSVPIAPKLLLQNEKVPALDIIPGEKKIYASANTNSLISVDIDLSGASTIAPLLNQGAFAGLRLTGPFTENLVIQTSTNLQDWVSQQTVSILDGATNVTLTNLIASSPQFYRTYLPPTEPDPDIPQIILDSDLGVDSDDIGDIALLHKFADMGLCKLIGMSFATQIPYGASALDTINTAYGRGDIPVGKCVVTWDTFDAYDQYLVEHYPSTHHYGTNAPVSVPMYRQLLAKAAPHSITIIEAAYVINLAQLILSGPDEISPLTGEELLNQKVKLLVIAAGEYPSGTELYFRAGSTGAATLINRLKCPMIFSGNSHGAYVRTAYLPQLRQFFPPDFLIRIAFERFDDIFGAFRREAWAQVLMWYVIAGPKAAGQKLFDVERGGYNYVDYGGGGNSMLTDRFSKQAYIVPVAREDDIVAAIDSLMYLPPGVLPLPYDPYVNIYAQLVASNGGSVNESTLQALDQYVKTLKSDGTWDQKRLVWPCAGNDLKAASCLLRFPFAYGNGIMPIVGVPPDGFVESQGLVGNGRFQFNTESSAFNLGMRNDTCHLALYSLRDVPEDQVADCGRFDDVNAALSLSMRYASSYTNPFFDSFSVFEGRVKAPQAVPTTGYFVGNRSSLTNSSLYRNEVLLATGHTYGGNLPPNALLIYSYQQGGQNSSRTYSHFSCGPGLTPSQMATDARAVKELQRALHRALPE